jgi:hypothetical protein
MEQTESATAPQRPRRMRKKTCFKKTPRGPWPIRALWEGATKTDQERAHIRCVAILEYWLGKASKSEIAQRLELPPLRIWQLSQQALSGMLAALVHQPRWREAKGVMQSRPAPTRDLQTLRKRIEEQKRQIATQDKIIELLRQFPGQSPPPKATTGSGEKRRTKKKTRTRTQASRRAAAAGTIGPA